MIILFTQIARGDVLSFQEWKKVKVTEAQVLSSSPTEATTKAQASKAGKSSKLEASKLALQIAEELTIDDYFALYLSQFKDKSDFSDAAKKLAPSEMADLLMTLKSTMDRAPSSGPQALSYSPLTSPDSQLKK